MRGQSSSFGPPDGSAAFEKQRERRAGVGGALRVGFEACRDRVAFDDRVTPLVQLDALGEQLRAEAVTDAVDRVHAKTHHTRAGTAVGISSTGAAAHASQGPWRAWSSNSAANVRSAVETKWASPFGWWHAPRPGSCAVQRSRSTNAVRAALPSAMPC